jgi:hypothetical protein
MRAKETKGETWLMATQRFSPLIKTSTSSQSEVHKSPNKLQKRGPSEKETRLRSLTFSQNGKENIEESNTNERITHSATSSDHLSQSTPLDSEMQFVEAACYEMPMLTEEEEDLEDALCPIYDQLKLKKSWWALEILPVRHRVQRENGSWDHEIT